jgi:hypothetical protein
VGNFKVRVNAQESAHTSTVGDFRVRVGAHTQIENILDVVAYCTCVFGLIKIKFRRLIVLISDDVVVMFFVRGRRLI